jgi:outer membrane receptor protein involved in Fe transport
MNTRIRPAAPALLPGRRALFAGAIIGLQAAAVMPALAAPDDSSPPPASATPAQVTPAQATTTEEVTVTAKRLTEARLGIAPQTGASTYTITNATIEAQPGGDNNALNEVVLQAPGVAQDNLANGGLHVRNEHLNVQYRIDGVVLPDGVSFFGQGLSPRFVNRLQLIDGALPAEYGLRTAGIIDIQTRSGELQDGGSIDLYGGSNGTFHPSFDYGRSIDGYDLFVSGDYLQSDRGIEGVTPKADQIHDDTLQDHGFVYLDKILNASSKISFMAGTFNGQFQIPNNPGQPTLPGISAIGTTPVTAFNSADLNEHQIESSSFGALSYLWTGDKLDFQVSAFTKYSDLSFHPDTLADLAFNGIGEQADRQSFANGFQADGSYRLFADHTLRGGFLLNEERVSSDTNSTVLPQIGTDALGNPIFGTNPESIIDDHEKTGWTYSVYLQDEWRILPSLTLNFGGRFDVVDEFTTGNQISPRLNAVWQPTDTTTVHAGYASYFTPPPFELVATGSLVKFAGTSAEPSVTQNDPIKNEHAQYLDLGATQTVLPGLSVGVDLYYKYSRNLLDEGQFGAPVILTPFNYHTGFNRGVELTTTYNSGGFSYYGNLSIAEQKAEGIDSAQFNFEQADLDFSQGHLINTDHSQLMTASAGVSYLLDDTRYSADIVAGTGVRTTPPGENINEGTVPSYEQVNLGLSHRFADVPGGPLTIRLDVINVLDEVYVLRSQTGIGVFAPQFGPRRSVFVGLKKEF